MMMSKPCETNNASKICMSVESIKMETEFCYTGKQHNKHIIKVRGDELKSKLLRTISNSLLSPVRKFVYKLFIEFNNLA